MTRHALLRDDDIPEHREHGAGFTIDRSPVWDLGVY
jgi:hypothetical protein